ncbi:hypothetical protein G3I70_45165 [Actinomadura bangladeshensis]|uniref:Uncharacterized protein n=1 Tax=Actinomadura bangladeshensis TaxID=453573 RepID=A0A6L9QWQ8_9ACTN|nr:hypothetical protein [Actinomadura bangladeshensis]
MEALLSVADSSDGTETASLYRWLAQDPDVRRDAEVTIVPAPARPGDMGGSLEVVNVVLSNAIAFSSLVVAVAAWIGSRRSSAGPVVRIERDGVAVTISADSPEAVREVLRALDGEAGGAE